jgi:hypothetical protein
MSHDDPNALFVSHKLVFMDQLERLIKSNEKSLQKKLKKKYDTILQKVRLDAEGAWDRFSHRFNAPDPSDLDTDFHVQLAADMWYLSIFGQYLTIPKGMKDDAKRATIFDTNEDPPF